MMTPDYASPEVVRGDHVTTAADVYALGVLLYELLTGRRPLRFATLSSIEIERVVCHVDPPRASAAAGLESDPPGISAATRAANRQTSAERLRAELRGDLDAVLATAMAKDPARRYASVDAFAADLQSYLGGRPIVARPATWAYTARRFVARHRWPRGRRRGVRGRPVGRGDRAVDPGGARSPKSAIAPPASATPPSRWSAS